MSMSSVSPPVYSEEFEDYYKSGLVPWELIDRNDLREFVCECGVRLGKIRRVLDLGCGRGIRFLTMAADDQAINRSDVTYCGVDFSQTAVDSARRVVQDVREGRLASPFAREDSWQCSIRFEHADVLSLPSDITSQPYDMVIDWMCSHELWEEGLPTFTRLLRTVCAKWYILKAYSQEGGEDVALPVLTTHVHRHCWSMKQIEERFADDFVILRYKQYPQNRNPVPSHGDKNGIEWAKRAYLMVRRCEARVG